MARPYSDDLRSRVVAAVASGESRRRAAARFGVAPSCAVKWVKRAAQTGSVSPGKVGGHRKPLLAPHRDWLLAQVEAEPEATVKGLQHKLAERGIRVSHDTVWRFLRTCGLTFKKRRWSRMNGPAPTWPANGRAGSGIRVGSIPSG